MIILRAFIKLIGIRSAVNFLRATALARSTPLSLLKQSSNSQIPRTISSNKKESIHTQIGSFRASFAYTHKPPSSVRHFYYDSLPGDNKPLPPPVTRINSPSPSNRGHRSRARERAIRRQKAPRYFQARGQGLRARARQE